MRPGWASPCPWPSWWPRPATRWGAGAERCSWPPVPVDGRSRPAAPCRRARPGGRPGRRRRLARGPRGGDRDGRHQHTDPEDRPCGPGACGAPGRSARRWCAAGVVAAVANPGGDPAARGSPGGRRVPWVLVLVVVAVSATAGLLTRPLSANDPLGPLDLLVPPPGGRRRRGGGLPASSRPCCAAPARLRPPTALGGDLAGAASPAGARPRARGGHDDRGHRAGDAGVRPGVAGVPARTVADRAARGGRRPDRDRVESSSRLDRASPEQAVEPEDGTPLAFRGFPVARNPALPPGQRRSGAPPPRSPPARRSSTCSSSTRPLRRGRAPGAHREDRSPPAAPGCRAWPRQDAATAAATRRNGIRRRCRCCSSAPWATSTWRSAPPSRSTR